MSVRRSFVITKISNDLHDLAVIGEVQLRIIMIAVIKQIACSIASLAFGISLDANLDRSGDDHFYFVGHDFASLRLNPVHPGGSAKLEW